MQDDASCYIGMSQWDSVSPTSETAAVPVEGALAVARLTKSSLIWQRLSQARLEKVTGIQ